MILDRTFCFYQQLLARLAVSLWREKCVEQFQHVAISQVSKQIRSITALGGYNFLACPTCRSSSSDKGMPYSFAFSPK